MGIASVTPSYKQYVPVDGHSTKKAHAKTIQPMKEAPTQPEKIKPGCAKNQEVDIAKLQTQAFKHLALELPSHITFVQEKAYQASFLPKCGVPEDLKQITVAARQMRSQESRA